MLEAKSKNEINTYLCLVCHALTEVRSSVIPLNQSALGVYTTMLPASMKEGLYVLVERGKLIPLPAKHVRPFIPVCESSF